MTGVRCPSCGAQGEGKFCTRCGASLTGQEAHCTSCGTPLEPSDRYCAECGKPAGRQETKLLSSKLPWVLSGVALLLFSVGIAYFVQGSSSSRAPGGTITGGIPSTMGADVAAEGSAGPGGSRMPSAAELAAMSPREAADRLFDRAMREREGGDSARTRFFAQMGLEAYRQVPAAQMDDDALFHVGLLHLAGGEVEAARAMADLLLEERPNHLFGLVLGMRAGATAGEAESVAEYRDRLEAAIAAGESPEEPPYTPHAALIRQEIAAEGS